ncbi:MAG: PEP-CTERM sorting domain-containing protein, partial [Chthoniobacterales bacterium]
TNGTNLVLFTYTGTFSGTSTLGTITFNTGSWTYGSVTTSGGIVQLTNLAMVPEPSSAALLLGAFGGLVVWTVRRKRSAKL